MPTKYCPPWVKVYNAYAKGVSPRCGIEQIHKGLHPKWTIPSKGEVRPSTKRHHTHDDTLSLRLNAYKLKVKGVSPRCGIEQIREFLLKADNIF